MNILNIEHISKIYGEKVIFEDASFGVQEGDKVGIIGINGTGKSTLLKMLAGEEVPETGQIIMQNNVRLAYLPQIRSFRKMPQFFLIYRIVRQNGKCRVI